LQRHEFQGNPDVSEEQAACWFFGLLIDTKDGETFIGKLDLFPNYKM
jgi:hypothetical protein